MAKTIKPKSKWQHRQSGEIVTVLDIKAGLVRFRMADFSELSVANSRFVQIYKEIRQ